MSAVSLNSTSGAAGRVPVGESLRFAVSLCCHPIRGFTEMKYEKRGRLWLATAFLCLWIFTNVFEHQVTNFLFNLDAYQPADILAEIRNVVLITLLFVLGNWSVTTLMDGEGSLKDIYMVIGYASLPLSIIRIPLALLTNSHFAELLDMLARMADYVIVDAPPVGVVIDAAEIAKACDGTLIAVNYNDVSRQELLDVKQQIEQTGCPILGTVLNQVDYDNYMGRKYYKSYSKYGKYGYYRKYYKRSHEAEKK